VEKFYKFIYRNCLIRFVKGAILWYNIYAKIYLELTNELKESGDGGV